jgi:sugar O-acyltransferase (sialic acid O-acetyltransferase NeuD family)
MNDLVVVGVGGLAKDVAFVVDEINRAHLEPLWNLLGFVIKDNVDVSDHTGRYSVALTEGELVGLEKMIDVAIGIGTPGIVRAVAAKLQEYSHIRFPNIIHPNVVMDHERVVLGEGNVICAGNVFTTDIAAGSFNYFNIGTIVGHDVVIGNHNMFSPSVNISGGVTVGSGCMIGTSAVVLPTLRIGDEAIVGAGAVVVRDVAPGTTVVGIPAREIERKESLNG